MFDTSSQYSFEAVFYMFYTANSKWDFYKLY